ncbi:MAG: hypothetical protein AAGG51_26795 [Cyanobacteria bacterium P01_G01_bin.54]
MFDVFRFPVLLMLPLASVIALGILGLVSVRAIAHPTVIQNRASAPPSDLIPILEEKGFEPDNNGSPGESSGAGGR